MKSIKLDRKSMHKLLVLSCFANVLLCLLIIYKCDTLPADIFHTPQISSLPRHTLQRYGNMRSDSISGSVVSKTKFLTGKLNLTGSVTQKTKNITSNVKLINTLKYEGSESKRYDPSFGLQHQTRHMPPRDVRELFPRAIPNMVFYVWCGLGHPFLYKHFVSIYSIWYHLEPDAIEIHYESPPLEDKYNTWLSWLQSNIPSFSLRPLPSHVTGSRCGTSFGLDMIADRGGLFLDNGVILHSTARYTMNKILTSIRSFSFHKDGTLAWVAAAAGDSMIKRFMSLSEVQQKSCNMSNFFHPQKHKYKDGYMAVDTYNCSKLHTRDLTKRNYDKEVYCQQFEDSINPIDILRSDNNSISRNLLNVLYDIDHPNSVRIEDTIVSDTENIEIPHVVHYIWFGRKNMSLSMYLSFLSCVCIVKPQMILVHTDLKLYGIYWNLVVKSPKVHIVYREAPSYIYEHRILYTQHKSDIVRADILNKYGGIYLDWDALWLKSPKDLLKSKNYDIILSRDHIPRPPFPDTINMGVVMAKPRSKFIGAWRAAWLHYRSDNFLYNAVELPYKIYELFPHTSLLHNRLQVMCYFLKCHPLFHPDHKHWGRAQPFNWTQDVYSIHFTHPDPPSFQNETALMSGHGMFAEIGRYVWNLSRNMDLR